MPGYRLAVLGSPVSHSRSPRIHTVLLEFAGLDGTYEAIDTDEPGLARLIDELRAGEWDGFNVTMPLKEAAASRADELSPDSRRARSVNTLHMSNGVVSGSTTDGSTFRGLYGSAQFGSASAIHVLGAGGSAAAALVAAGTSRPLFVSARRREAAEALADHLGGGVLEWGQAVTGALLVNATPLGMGGESLPSGLLEAASGLIDLPYGSASTPAVTTASQLGIPVVAGLEFLIRQAIESFNLWTGSGVAFGDVAHALRKI